MSETVSLATYHELETSFWLPAGSESALERLISAMRDGQATIFTIAMPSTSGFGAALDSVFALAGSPRGSAKHRLIMPFTWSHQRGFSLPSMTGELTARRFGPIAYVRVRALYAYDADTPGRIFHEAIGEQVARKTFDALTDAIRLLLAPSRKEVSPCAPSQDRS